MAQREDFELLKAVENATNYYLIDEDKTQPQNTRRTYTRPQKEWKVWRQLTYTITYTAAYLL